MTLRRTVSVGAAALLLVALALPAQAKKRRFTPKDYLEYMVVFHPEALGAIAGATSGWGLMSAGALLGDGELLRIGSKVEMASMAYYVGHLADSKIRHRYGGLNVAAKRVVDRVRSAVARGLRR